MMIRKLMNKPLMITSLKLDTLFCSVPKGDDYNVVAYNTSVSDAGNLKRNSVNNYENNSGIAIIPIHGLLTKYYEYDRHFFEMISYAEIHESIAMALEDPEAKSILLDIDSPGGEVSWLFDLVDFIYESRNVKPIYAIANDYAFSAAYAIASATSKIFVNRTSGVGSIGVIATHVDVSEMDKKEGIKYTTIFAGDKKNDLSPHEPISDAAISDLQKEVNRLYEMFVAVVARNRGISAEHIRGTQAALYYGTDARSFGLADEVADFWKCISIIGAGLSPDAGISAMQGLQQLKGVNMTEDIENYKAEVMEISKLCKLAHAENKLAEFIEQNLSPDEVKEKLLACVNTRDEIRSTIYHKEAVQENPLMAAAKARAKTIV